MSKSTANASETISDILPEIIDQQGFIPYMNGLMFQSIQMVNKQTLKIDQNEVYNPDIVRILSSSCQYVDNAYFSIFAKEDRTNPNFKNFPV